MQEEIRFIVSPELIATLLITEELDDDECLGNNQAEENIYFHHQTNRFLVQ